MGREQIGARKRIYLCIAGLICSALCGCGWTTKPAQVPPAPPKAVARQEAARIEIPSKPETASKPEPASKPESPPPVPQVSAKAPDPEAKALKQSAEQLRRARKLMAQKDYEGSFKLSHKILLLAGKQPPGDEALFQMALIFVHGENPKKDYAKSIFYFQKVVKEFPESPLTEEAKAWIGVLQENEHLKEMLEKAKEVDITVDEKKREKAK